MDNDVRLGGNISMTEREEATKVAAGHASDAYEELVFGELEQEEDEEFKTPLAASRSSSVAGDVTSRYQSVTTEQAADKTGYTAADANSLATALTQVQLQQEANPETAGNGVASTVQEPSVADEDASSSQSATSEHLADAISAHSQTLADAPATAESAVVDASNAAPVVEVSAATPASSTAVAADAVNGTVGAPQLEAAADAAGTKQQRPHHQRHPSLPEPQVWREGSGMVTLRSPGQQHSSTGTGSDDGDSDSEASWGVHEHAAAASAAADPSTAAGAAAVESPFLTAPVASAAESSAAGPAVSTTSSNRSHQQRQAPQSPVSMVSLGSLGSPRAPGVERTASWQLQHAAAAAAGTAAHPAPPRSDLQLTRLSSSPSSPHGEDGWAAWQRRRRHFFVLTAAGKPVFSLHGDEQALAGFMAVIQALVSVIADQGDSINSITVGPTQLVFLLKGQLYFVAVSSRSEAPGALRRQLELLYQTILMFVTGGIEKMLQRSPGYDVQQLLTGSKASLMALTSSFADCPGWMMGTVEPAPAAPADRQAAAAALQDAVKSSDALYGVLLVGSRVLGAETGKGPPPLNTFDLLLLANFTNSNESLRHSETFVPVCLPNFQPSAFLHAYIANLEPQQQQQQQQQHPQSPRQQQQHRKQQLHYGNSSSVFLLLLSGSADSFHKLSAAKQVLAVALGSGSAGGVLGRVTAAAAAPERGRLSTASIPAPLGGGFGSTPLWHAVIRYPHRRQHTTLSYPQQLFGQRSQQKQLVRSYCRLFCAAYAPLLEAGLHGTKSSTGTAPGVTSQPGGPGSSSGPAGGTSSSSSAASSIANIVGAGTGSMGSGAAAAAAAAAAYVLPYAGMQPRSHKLVWVTSQKWVTGVVVDREVEVYVTFDPLTEKDVGLKLIEQLRRYFADKARQQELLVPGL